MRSWPFISKIRRRFALLPACPLNPAASRGIGPYHRSGSTAHDHHTAVATPHHRFCPRPPLSHRHWPPAADRNLQRRLRLAKPGTSNTRSLSRSDPGPPKPAFRWSLNPPPCLEPTNHIKHRRQIPIDRHQRRCKLPPRFPPSRLFGRLPPCTPSRPCLAGIRKPLTIADLPPSPQNGEVRRKAAVHRPRDTGHEPTAALGV